MPPLRAALTPAAAVAPEPWRNGGGSTRVLHAWPDAASWRLRISLAEINRAGPFSAYPGVTRWFAVVDGAGVELSLAGAARRLDTSSPPLQFAGELPVDCRLLAGPTRDLNLMARGGAAVMLRARTGHAWTSPLPMRGLYTQGAGLWRAGAALPVPVPGEALLWCEGAAGESFSFEPADAQAPGATLWLGFAADPRAG